MKFCNCNSLSILVLSLLVSLCAILNAAAQGQEPANACELFTQTDAHSLFQESISGQRAKKTSFPAGHKCSYSYKKNSDVFGVSVRISRTSELREEGMNDSAADLFGRQKKARLKGDHAKEHFTMIEDIGDEAFWNGDDLWILTQESVIIIDVDSALAGSFPDRATADAAQKVQNLGLSREVAATVLSRM